MVRKNSSSSKLSPAHLIKKFSLSAIILLLVWTLFQLAENIHASLPAKIPGSHSNVELYSNQTNDDLTGIYQQAIDGAQQSIMLVMYGLTDQTVIQALKRKCESGIPVHIVCDPEASKWISNDLPDATIVKRWGLGLMHQKILIIDQQQIWMGSANLTSSSLNIHGNLVMGVDHPPLAKTLAARAKMMDGQGGALPLSLQKTTAGSQHLEFWTMPDDKAAVGRIIELFRSAKKTIKIAMFFWTRHDFAKELLAAAQRGVKVEAVIDEKSGHGASKRIVMMLDKGRIDVGLSTSPGLLHHKFAYIDESILVNGSANWTTRAFKDNDDYFVVVYPLTEEQKAKMDQLWKVIRKQSERPDFSK